MKNNRRIVIALITGTSLGSLSALAEPVPITGATDAHPLVGTWMGFATTEGARAEVGLRFKTKPDGTLVAIFDLPQTNIRGVGGWPVKQEGAEFRFYEFRVRLDDTGQTLTGQLPYYSRRLDLELQKGRPVTAPPSLLPAGPSARPVWTFDAGAPIWSAPLVNEGRVYFGSQDGVLHALDAATGQRSWKFETRGAIVAKPLIVSGDLYVPSDDGFLYKLDLATRKELWRFDTHGGAVKRVLPDPKAEGYDYQASSPVLADGTVFVGSADGHLYAVDSRDGKERWRFKTGGLVRSTPAVANGRVLFGSFDGSVYAVEAASGKELWKYATGDAVNSSPALVSGIAYIGSRSTDLYAFDAASGAIRWKYYYWMSWVESSPVLKDGMLYVGSSDYQRVYALDARDGAPKRWFDTEGSAWSTPAVTEQTVYIGAVGTVGYMADHHGGFFALDRETGRERWRFPMSPIEGSFTSGVASSPAVADGRVYFGGLDGKFYALPQ